MFTSSITNCYATGVISGNGSAVGGVAGFVYNGGNLTNCYATGAVSGNQQVGGVAGQVYGGYVTNCYATGAVSGNMYLGGIVGDVSGTSSVTNCYATGAVNGNYYVGGVAGSVGGSSVTNCYATGTVQGIEIVGGIAGRVASNSSVTNCTALNSSVTRLSGEELTFGRVAGSNDGGTVEDNIVLQGMAQPAGATGENGTDVTPANAKLQASYTGWNFGTTDIEPWKMGVGSYELLVFYWQTVVPATMPEHLR